MSKIKLTDLLAKYLVSRRIKNVFSVIGGANLHIIDSLSKNKNIKLTFNHHEQAAALAAQASARVSKVPGVCVITTGPGGTNALTGLLSAWQDSIPCIFISGQSRSNIIKNTFNLRQLGAQGFDIIKLVKPITKKAITVLNEEKFFEILDEYYFSCLSGRPGPVWIDIPFDIQIKKIDNFKKLQKYKKDSFKINSKKINYFKSLILNSKKPILLAGNGIHTSNTEKKFLEFVYKFKFPTLLTWNASDLIEYSNKYNLGIPGMFGQRAANLIIQNCDLIIAIGSHLNLSITTPAINKFSPNSKLILVNIDDDEIYYSKKKPSLAIKSDLNDFFLKLNKIRYNNSHHQIKWLKACNLIKSNFNKNYIKKYKNKIDPYDFIDQLSILSKRNKTFVIDGGGTCNQIFFQSFKNKKNQRMIISAGICAMGSGLPDSIGIAKNNKKRDIFLVCGDGSLQLNIQELQTIKDNKLNIKIFIFSNNGYLSIRHTQSQFLNKNYIGSIKSGGLNFPNIKKIANSYSIDYLRISNISEFKKKLLKILKIKKPYIIEIMMPDNYKILPRMEFIKQNNGKFIAAGLENMYPFLSNKNKNLINKLLKKNDN